MLLQALYEEFGLSSLLIHAAHEFTAETAPWLPAELRAYLEGGPIPDVHTFLRLHIDGQWMTVDATWPLAPKASGCP